MMLDHSGQGFVCQLLGEFDFILVDKDFASSVFPFASLRLPNAPYGHCKELGVSVTFGFVGREFGRGECV